MCLFQAHPDTCLDSPLLASLSVHGLHFTVYALREPIWRESFRLSIPQKLESEKSLRFLHVYGPDGSFATESTVH